MPKMPTVTVIELKDFKDGATKGTKAIGGVLDDFKAFLNKGNVVDLAVSTSILGLCCLRASVTGS